MQCYQSFETLLTCESGGVESGNPQRKRATNPQRALIICVFVSGDRDTGIFARGGNIPSYDRMFESRSFWL